MALVGPEWAGAVDAVQSFSCFLVVVVAFLVGFRPAADTAAWLWFCGLLVPVHPGHHLAGHVLRPAGRTSEGAAFSYILLLLIFISPAFVPTDS